MAYEEQLSDFASVPWAQALITNPSFKPTKTFSRVHPAPSKTENALLASALHNPDCVRAVASFHHYPALTNSDPESLVEHETRMLFSLGTSVNGHEGCVAGGFIGSMIDETMWQCVATIFGRSFVTACLELKFMKMITTPRVLLSRAWIEETAGKKFWLKATLEDGEGEVLAAGNALFILTKLPKL